MKHFITLALIATSFSSFGQTRMFWNNYSAVNPAMSGFEHQYHGTIATTEVLKYGLDLYNINANYNQRLFGKHGVGITYAGDYHWPTKITDIKLNYNFQFDLEKAGKIATGIGIGYRNASCDGDSPPETLALPFFQRSYSYGLMNFGVVYSWKNLVVGVSTTDNVYLISDREVMGLSKKLGYNLHASYDFQLGRNFQLTPRLFFTAHESGKHLTMDLTTTFMKRYSLGVMANAENSFGIHAGWDVREKFRISYAVTKTRYQYPGYQDYTLLSQELTLGFFLKEKKPRNAALSEI